MASSTSSASRKAAKDLACADCQRRKKRCDKQSPCSNCIKHNVPCVPSSPAPPRKRRQPMKELLERLAACEERLKHCNCHQSQFPPLPPLQKPLSHEHHHGAPPSPPASAASRDAAIANMLDYSCDDESMVKKERSPYATTATTTTTRYFDLMPGPGTTMGPTGDAMRAGGT